MSTSATGVTSAAPTDFFCEHGADASRLLVVLHRAGHSPAALTVLICPDAGVTEAVAGLLRDAVEHGLTPCLQADVDQLARARRRTPAAT